MPATLNFYPVIDQNQWRPNAPAPTVQATGSSLVGDMRNDATRHPHLYFLNGTTLLYAYDPLQDDWLTLASPALSAFAVGACAVFHPSQGPRGTLTSGNTTSKVVLSTALPAAVGVNQLANRGDGKGFRIRIVGSSSGGSGLVQERTIVANTSGTTPTIWLDSVLTGTTGQSGDTYEILSGRLFMLGSGATGANSWKYYDVATNFFSASLGTTNLPASITTDTNLVALSESHVPNTKSPGQGFYGNLVSTGTAAGTITGTAAGADAGVLINQFRNFQIRIIQDATTPTAVGQRRRITSHTAGASPVYTLASNWTVTPTSGATFVIENDDDKIICLTSANTSVFNYNIGANTWDTTTWATAVANGAGNVAFQAFGVTPDVGANVTNSQIVRIRGGATSNIDILDISAAATGAWTNGIVYGGLAPSFAGGSCGAYDPVTLGGQYIHLNLSGTQRQLRYDVLNRVLSPGTYLRYPAGAVISGGRMACVPFVDASGSPKLNFLYQISPSNAAMFSMAVPR